MFNLVKVKSAFAVKLNVRKFSQNLSENFTKASQAINNPANKKDVSNETKLKLYAFYKQAEAGICNTSRPGLFDPVGRAKYDAWKSLNNLTKEDAMKSYIDLVTTVFDGKLPETSPVDTSSKPEVKPSASAPKEEVTLESVAFPKKFKKVISDLDLETIAASTTPSGVVSIELNRPNKGNSFNMKMWNDFRNVFAEVEKTENPRVVVLSGKNGNFSTGMDLSVFMDLNSIAQKESCEARRREGAMNFIQYLQDSISAPENCSVPVIAAISGHCIGGAVDLISSCDMRYCTKNAVFCVKETDLAIVADIGTLQRLPKIIGNQLTAEVTYTGRNISGEEAERIGLVLKCFDSEADMMAHVSTVAEQIAAKSPITIRGVKKVLIYQRDHNVKDSLNQVKLWNSAYVFSEDLMEAAGAMMSKKKPVFKV